MSTRRFERTHTDDVEVRIRVGLLLRDLALAQQDGDVLGPLGAQLVGARQAAVATAADEGLDAVLDEVQRGLAAPLELAKGRRARGADERAAGGREAADVVPADTEDVAAFELALGLALFEELALAVGVEEARVALARGARRLGLGLVPADEALPALADDVHLAAAACVRSAVASASGTRCRGGRRTA